MDTAIVGVDVVTRLISRTAADRAKVIGHAVHTAAPSPAADCSAVDRARYAVVAVPADEIGNARGLLRVEPGQRQGEGRRRQRHPGRQGGVARVGVALDVDLQPAGQTVERARAEVQRGGEEPAGHSDVVHRLRRADLNAARGRVVQPEPEVIDPGGRGAGVHQPALVGKGRAQIGQDAGRAIRSVAGRSGD